MTGKTLAHELRSHGITVRQSYESDDMTDGGCDLCNDLSVQIAGNILVLNHWNEEEGIMTHLGMFRAPAEVAVKVRARASACRIGY